MINKLLLTILWKLLTRFMPRWWWQIKSRMEEQTGFYITAHVSRDDVAGQIYTNSTGSLEEAEELASNLTHEQMRDLADKIGGLDMDTYWMIVDQWIDDNMEVE